MQGLGRIALMFSLAGGIAVFGIVRPGDTEPGWGSYAVALLGASWIALFAATVWSESAPSDLIRLRLKRLAAAAAMVVSLIAAAGAVSFALERGLTLELPKDFSGRAPVLGKLLLWLFPIIGILATIGSLLLARTIYRETDAHAATLGRSE